MSDATDQILNSLPGLIQGGAAVVGTNQATGQVVQGNQNAIDTQRATQSQLQNIYSPATTTGNQAFTTLGSLFGTNGQAPDYSSFNNQPGYQFAVQQGTQAINRQAAANGSLYTPQTLASVGNYVQGQASQSYNTYVQQLLTAAGLGGQANAGLAQGDIQTGTNISQAQINQGNANASGTLSNAGVIGSTLGNSNLLSGAAGLIKGLTGGSPGAANASGVAGAAGSVLNGASSLFGGGTNGTPGYSDYNPVTGQGNFGGSSLFGNYAASNGYDPTTGQYTQPSTDPYNLNLDSEPAYDFNSSSGSGYDPFTGDYSSPDSFSLDSLGGSTF